MRSRAEKKAASRIPIANFHQTADMSCSDHTGQPFEPLSPETVGYVRKTMKTAIEVQGRIIDFISRQCTAVYENLDVEIRHTGQPYPPSVTIPTRRGACRDLALLIVAACRNVGIAARFVSGRQEGDEDTEHPHLHAWAEVYLPGGGWRGYDPTHGPAVSDRHLVLAASREPEGAASLKGSFRGTDVSTEMRYRISLSKTPFQSLKQDHSHPDAQLKSNLYSPDRSRGKKHDGRNLAQTYDTAPPAQ